MIRGHGLGPRRTADRARRRQSTFVRRRLNRDDGHDAATRTTTMRTSTYTLALIVLATLCLQLSVSTHAQSRVDNVQTPPTAIVFVLIGGFFLKGSLQFKNFLHGIMTSELDKQKKNINFKKNNNNARTEGTDDR